MPLSHLKTGFFRVFLGPYRSNFQEYMLSLKKKQNFISTFFHRVGTVLALDTGRPDFFKNHAGKLPMTIPMWSPKNEVICNGKSGAIVEEWYHGYGPGQTTMTSAHFVFLRRGPVFKDALWLDNSL